VKFQDILRKIELSLLAPKKTRKNAKNTEISPNMRGLRRESLEDPLVAPLHAARTPQRGIPYLFRNFN